MPGSMYPGMGQTGPMPQASSLSALAQFLGVPSDTLGGGGPDDGSYESDTMDPVSAAAILKRGLFKQEQDAHMSAAAGMGVGGGGGDTSQLPLAIYQGVGDRNQALTEMIAHKYGVPGIADGSISQSQIQSADDQISQGELADKLAPINAKGQIDQQTERIKGDYGLQGDRIRNQGTSNVAEINHRSDLEKERLHGEAALAAAQAKQPVMGPGGMPINDKPLTATEDRAVSSMNQLIPLIDQLEGLLDPSQNQVPNKLEATAKYFGYKMGLTTPDPKDQAKINLAGLIKVLGAAPYVAGSRHFQFMQQAQEHLTDPSASDAFLYNQLQELKTIHPQMLEEIISSHRMPGKPLEYARPVDRSFGAATGGGTDLGANW